MRVRPASVLPAAVLVAKTLVSAVFINAALTCQGWKLGRPDNTRAAAPAVSGPEKLVPLLLLPPNPVPTSAIQMLLPGAVMSGFSAWPACDGPRDEKSEIRSTMLKPATTLPASPRGVMVPCNSGLADRALRTASPSAVPRL